MKRSRPSGPKTHIPSDFAKRPRAKVGKRAKKTANVTDTKFRAASVQVREQDGVARGVGGVGAAAGGSGRAGGDEAQQLTSLELMSSRGKSLQLLLSTLSHHSHTVRLSSLSGIRDAISGQRASAAAVRANLNAIVPGLAKCCVDDDDEVRSAGMELLREVASRVGEMDGTTADGDDNTAAPANSSEVAARHLSPYLPLLVAYVTSALNSLDVSIRLDGARAVETLVQVLGMANVGPHSQEMLPGFVRVLVDAKTKSATTALTATTITTAATVGKKKKKKGGGGDGRADAAAANNPAQNAKSAAVLRSLVMLLRAAASASSSSPSCDDGWSESETVGGSAVSFNDLTPSLAQPELVFLRGGSATNAVLAYRDRTAAAPDTSLLSLNALAVSVNRSAGSDGINSDTISVSIAIQVELFSRLRDRLIELSQAGHTPGGGGRGGLCLPSAYVEEMNGIVSAVRLLWSLYSRSVIVSSLPTNGTKDGEEMMVKKLRSITRAIQSQFIGLLPITADDGGRPSERQDQGRYDATNAILCSALGEFGSILDPMSRLSGKKDGGKKSGDDMPASSAWTNAVFSYVLPRLERSSDENAAGDGDQVVDVTILRVVGQLLLGPYLDNEPARRTELLTKFGEAFFRSSSDGGDNDIIDQSLCVSSAGRLAAMLLVVLLLRHLPAYNADESCDNVIAQQKTRALVGSMAQALPMYLKYWDNHFPLESAKLLAALMAVVRGYKTGSPMNCDGSVIEVFDEADKDMNGAEDESADPLVLLVRSLRNSMGILYEQPSKKKSKDKKNTPRQSIFEGMPDQTQRLALGLFGLLQYPKETAVMTLAKICSRFIVRDEMKDYIMDVMHSIRQTLPMQLYLTFLVNSSGIKTTSKGRKKKNKSQEDAESLVEQVFAFDSAIERLCRSIVLCGGSKLLPMLTPLLLSWLGSEDSAARAALAILACMSFDSDVTSEAFEATLDKAIIGTVYGMLRQVTDSEAQSMRRLTPVLALLTKRSRILENILNETLEGVSTAGCLDERALEGIIRSLLMMLKHAELGAILKQGGYAAVLEDVATALEKEVADGPLDRMGGILRTEVQIHIGRQVATR